MHIIFNKKGLNKPFFSNFIIFRIIHKVISEVIIRCLKKLKMEVDEINNPLGFI